MKATWPSGLKGYFTGLGVAWRGHRVGSNYTGDIYFHVEFFNLILFRTAQWIPCKCKHDHSPVVIVVLDSRYD